ncbi:hypothetical protein [Agromyces bauzanensis]|uniref:Uncharacterized protein n=1 Tax=Agromyces bauzanensis TaxID=1308924 RepID=A0A917PUM0_9MICO|nr:hypothetical protein [Agromyces bauzanensis]GGJ92600.1 hypothetical protein GCM10011372_33910 [Agromyces bauzanensis]
MPDTHPSTTPEERNKALDDMHYELLMQVFVGAAGLRQLIEAQAFGEKPAKDVPHVTVKGARRFLDSAVDEIVAFTSTHREYYPRTLDAAERVVTMEPLLRDFAKRMKRAGSKR